MVNDKSIWKLPLVLQGLRWFLPTLPDPCSAWPPGPSRGLSSWGCCSWRCRTRRSSRRRQVASASKHQQVSLQTSNKKVILNNRIAYREHVIPFYKTNAKGYLKIFFFWRCVPNIMWFFWGFFFVKRYPILQPRSWRPVVFQVLQFPSTDQLEPGAAWRKRKARSRSWPEFEARFNEILELVNYIRFSIS